MQKGRPVGASIFLVELVSEFVKSDVPAVEYIMSAPRYGIPSENNRSVAPGFSQTSDPLFRHGSGLVPAFLDRAVVLG